MGIFLALRILAAYPGVVATVIFPRLVRVILAYPAGIAGTISLCLFVFHLSLKALSFEL